MQENEKIPNGKKPNLIPLIIAVALIIVAVILAIVLINNDDTSNPGTPNRTVETKPEQTMDNGGTLTFDDVEVAERFSLTLVPSAETVKKGDEFTVAVKFSNIASAKNVAAFDFTVLYDTNSVQYVKGEYVNLPFDESMHQKSIVALDGGKLKIVALDYSPEHEISEDGVYVNLTFKAIKTGAAVFSVDKNANLDFCDKGEGNATPILWTAETFDGTVTIK